MRNFDFIHPKNNQSFINRLFQQYKLEKIHIRMDKIA